MCVSFFLRGVCVSFLNARILEWALAHLFIQIARPLLRIIGPLLIPLGLRTEPDGPVFFVVRALSLQNIKTIALACFPLNIRSYTYN